MLRFHVSNNCVTFYCVFQRVEDPREWCGPSILVEACKPYRDVRVWTSHSRMKIEKKNHLVGSTQTATQRALLSECNVSSTKSRIYICRHTFIYSYLFHKIKKVVIHQLAQEFGVRFLKKKNRKQKMFILMSNIS